LYSAHNSKFSLFQRYILIFCIIENRLMREEDDRRRDMLLRSDMGMRGGHRGQMEQV
jgi:hypothetical protein